MRMPRLMLAAVTVALLGATLSACDTSVNGAGGLVGAPGPSGVAGTGASPGGTSGSPGSPSPSGSSGSTGTGKPVPKGFVARDFTFVSLSTGWLLGYVGACTPSSCAAAIAHTTNGGKTWTSVAAPKAGYVPVAQAGCDSPCVWGLRFATSKIGYAYGPASLFVTTDGGTTWQHQSTNADALEIANGTVLRLSHTTPGCPPGCTYTVSTAAVGSTSWKPVSPAVSVTGNQAKMLRVGHRAFLEVYQNPAGGSEDAHATLLTSTDDGKHWTQRDDPCPDYGGSETDSLDMAVANDGSLAVLCKSRSGNDAFVIVSTDAGATFGPMGAIQPGESVGLANSHTPLVQFDAGGTQPELLRSTNGGATFASVASSAGTVPEGYAGVLGFESATVGRWAPGDGPIFTTSDAGGHWSAHSFS